MVSDGKAVWIIVTVQLVALFFFLPGCTSLSHAPPELTKVDVVSSAATSTFEQIQDDSGMSSSPSGSRFLSTDFSYTFRDALHFDVSMVEFAVILRSIMRELEYVSIRWSGDLTGSFSGKWTVATYSDLVELLEIIARYSGNRLEIGEGFDFWFYPIGDSEYGGSSVYRGPVSVSSDVVELVSTSYGVTCDVALGIVTCFGPSTAIASLDGVWGQFARSVVAGWKIVPTGEVDWAAVVESLGMENVVAVVSRGDGFTVISSAVEGAVESVVDFGLSAASDGCIDGFVDPSIPPEDLIGYLDSYIRSSSWCRPPVVLGTGVAWSILGTDVKTLERVLIWAQKKRSRAYGLAVVVDRRVSRSWGVMSGVSLFRWVSGIPELSENFRSENSKSVRYLGAALNNGVMNVGVSSQRFVSGDVAQGVGGQVVGTRNVQSGFRVTWDGRTHEKGWTGKISFSDTRFGPAGGVGGSQCGPVDVSLTWGEEFLVCSVYAKSLGRGFSLRDFSRNESDSRYDLYVALGGGMVSGILEGGF